VLAATGIRITRESGFVIDRIRAYKVVLDKRVIASLHEGETKHLDVAPGAHGLHLRIDYCRSQSVRFEVQPGEIVEFTCRPNARMWTAPFFLTVGRTHYLSLRRIPTAETQRQDTGLC